MIYLFPCSMHKLSYSLHEVYVNDIILAWEEGPSDVQYYVLFAD